MIMWHWWKSPARMTVTLRLLCPCPISWIWIASHENDKRQYFFFSTFFQILPKIVQCLKPLEISSATGSKMKYFLFDLFRDLGQIIGLVLSCNCDKIIKNGLITVYWNKRGQFLTFYQFLTFFQNWNFCQNIRSFQINIFVKVYIYSSQPFDKGLHEGWLSQCILKITFPRCLLFYRNACQCQFTKTKSDNCVFNLKRHLL